MSILAVVISVVHMDNVLEIFSNIWNVIVSMNEFKTNYGFITTSIVIVLIFIIVVVIKSFKDLTNERNSLQDKISRLEKDGRDQKSERNVAASYINYHFDGDMMVNRNMSNINTRNDQSQVTITNMRIEINELKENCEKMILERLDLTTGIEKLRKENIDLIHTNENLESTNEMLGNHCKLVKDEHFDIIESDEFFYQNENANLKKEIISVEEVNSYLKKGFDDLKRNEEHSSQQLNQTREELKAMTSACETLKEENTDRIKNLFPELIQTIEQLQVEKSTCTFLKNENSILQKDRSEMAQKANELQAALKSIKKDEELLKLQCERIQRNANLEISKLEKELENIKSQSLQYISEHQELFKEDNKMIGLKRKISCKNCIILKTNFEKYNPEKNFIEGVKSNNYELIVLALQNGADVNTVIPQEIHAPALVFASYHGNLNTIEILVKYGADINITSSNEKCSALYYACYRGCNDIVQFLLRKDADINIANSCGWTSLHIAVRQNRIDIVKVLLKNGAKTYLYTKDGDTANTLAIKNNCIEIRRLLES